MTLQGAEETLLIFVQKIIFQQSFATIFSGHPVAAEPIQSLNDDAAVVIRAKRSAYLNPPLPGETWTILGRWVDIVGYGRQFDAIRATRTRPQGRLIVPFIASRVDGIGPVRAARLWDRFADTLPDVLKRHDVAALAAVLAPAQPALSRRLAEDLLRAWSALESEAAVLTWLQNKGIDDVRAAARILEVIGGRAIEVLNHNPYVLVSLLPWKRVDDVAQRLLNESSLVGETRSDARRLVGAADSLVKDVVSDGDTLIAAPDLPVKLAKKLGVSERSSLVKRCIQVAERNFALLASPKGWRAPGCALLEHELAAKLRALASTVSMQWDPARGGRWLDSLSVEQRAASEKVLGLPLAVLAGGAGTGKTTTVRAICDAWEASDGKVVLCALSGKATVVLTKKASGSGRPRSAMTLFRLLRELDSSGSGSAASLPPPGRTLFVVDEASMVDLGQWHRLVDLLPAGSRLLMVGDPAQLPPIGMGIVFHHLCEIDALTAKLETVHRQAGTSGIPAVAADIREGRRPSLSVFSGRAAAVSFVDATDQEITGAIQDVVKELGGFVRGRHALQIICPSNDRHPASVRRVNAAFQLTCRQPGAEIVEGYRGQFFATDDPVLFLRNDYATELRNGSLGHVVSADEDGRRLLVDFDGNRHTFVGEQLMDLDLAYAMTCHKAQGSQCESVVIPIYESRLLDPSWIYTALTRAERQVVFVGNDRIFLAALSGLPAWRRRNTGFQLDLKM
ncbi:Exodeoxyribonuclease V alpha chain [Hyphomicrobiales bacterium]|nr:Exodeoxyribonuclease V alpha chain [Hyphomicrobiales bacterium]CAH1699850.1 Exodeoxyribonuclease V alpha chain [Hyphomicrobiales bacterium]